MIACQSEEFTGKIFEFLKLQTLTFKSVGLDPQLCHICSKVTSSEIKWHCEIIPVRGYTHLIMSNIKYNCELYQNGPFQPFLILQDTRQEDKLQSEDCLVGMASEQKGLNEYTYFLFIGIGEGNGNPSSVLAWRIP